MDVVIDNKKCYNCGKAFRTPADLLKHKNRKTPCLIREVPHIHINNPNRCIYCNKIFSKKENLTRHLTICKIKNGGMDMLVDKVRYEQEIRILREELAAERRENHDQLQQLREEFVAFKQTVNTNPPQVVNNNTTNNNNINNTVNIMINNYKTPSIEGVTITPAELANIDKLSKFILQKLYCNPSLPQNHCVYLKNKKDKTLIVYDNGKWDTVIGDNVAEVIQKLKDVVYVQGAEIINGKLGPYGGTDAQFLTLPGGDQQKIVQFNGSSDTFSGDDAIEIFLGGRDVVIGAIKASGCKLV